MSEFLKFQLRPAVAISRWSTDANQVTGPQTGQPTKVDPGDAVRAEGFHADQRPPAEWLNHKLNADGEWIAHLADLPVYNFSRPVLLAAAAGFFSPGFSNDNTAESLAFNPQLNGGYGAWVAVGTDGTRGRLHHSPDGAYWKQSTTFNAIAAPSTPNPCKSVVVRPSTGAMLVGCTGGEVAYWDTAAWTLTALSNSGDVARSSWDEVHDLWIIAIRNTSANLTKIRTSPDGVTFTERNLGSATNVEPIDVQTNAAGITVVVAADNRVWVSTDGTAYTLDATTPGAFTGNVTALTYSETLACWFVVTDGGRCYRSASGSGWTQMTSGVGAFGSRLVSLGGLLISCTSDSSTIRVSDDAITWRSFAIPRCSDGAGGADFADGPSIAALVAADGRIAVSISDATTSAGAISLSLRVAAGHAISAP